MTGPEIENDFAASSEPSEVDDAQPSTAESEVAEPATPGRDQQALEGQATQLEGDLESVDAALKRLDDGTYATCESCGATLSDEQLVADPTRRTCVDGCASR